MRVGNQYVVSMPIVTPQQPLGMLHIGVDVDFVDKIVLDMLFDVLVVLVVSLFFTLELLQLHGRHASSRRRCKSLGDTIERGAGGRLHDRAQRDAARHGVRRRARPARSACAHASTRPTTRWRGTSRPGAAARRTSGRPALTAAHQRACRHSRSATASAPPSASTRVDEGHLAKVRAPLFVFILAEELTRSFLPGYVNELLVPIPGCRRRS